MVLRSDYEYYVLIVCMCDAEWLDTGFWMLSPFTIVQVESQE